MAEGIVDRAQALFASRQFRQGMDLLGQAARSGDAGALEMLAAMVHPDTFRFAHHESAFRRLP